MLAVGDWLDALLFGCFFFGLVFSAASLLLGAGHLAGHHPGIQSHTAHGAHLGHGHHHNSAAPERWWPLGLLNTSSILAFLAWFGGLGYLTRNGLGWPVPIALLTGVAGGIVAAWLVFRVLVGLVRAEHPLDPADYELPGILARVTSTIRAGGTGEVVYEQAGVRQVIAARAADGTAMPHGQEVVILGCAHGVATVELVARLLAEADSTPGSVAGDQAGRHRAQPSPGVPLPPSAA